VEWISRLTSVSRLKGKKGKKGECERTDPRELRRRSFFETLRDRNYRPLGRSAARIDDESYGDRAVRPGRFKFLCFTLLQSSPEKFDDRTDTGDTSSPSPGRITFRPSHFTPRIR
jgi:hypothetical protein